MKNLLYTLFIIAFAYSNGQSVTVPQCLREKLSKEPHLTLVDSLRLPNHEMVYRTQLSRPKQCMDCMAGTIFLDKNCKTIAKKTIGRSFNTTIEKGYLEEWFDFDNKKNTTLIDSNPKEDSSIVSSLPKFKMFEEFKQPKRFKVNSIHQNQNIFKLKEGDIIEIGHKTGLSIFRNNKKISEYKLIPRKIKNKLVVKCVKAPCPPVNSEFETYEWGNYGIIITASKQLKFYNTSQQIKNQLIFWKTIADLSKT